MTYREEMLLFNEKFVENKEYECFTTTKYPDRKVAILTCMDTRLSALLPAALNIRNGDAKIIKNAGALIKHPFGSVMRSLLICIYELGVREIWVIGHYDCGMQAVSAGSMVEKMLERGVKPEAFDQLKQNNVDINEWLKGFRDPAESVRETLEIIKKHPLVPEGMDCSGYLMDPLTGRVDIVQT
ncbi:MAG: carbonic anhydrase [Clostridiaceae bacterium]|nr:carbonic anhydrase [Clostridiaceae bacterium]